MEFCRTVESDFILGMRIFLQLHGSVPDGLLLANSLLTSMFPSFIETKMYKK